MKRHPLWTSLLTGLFLIATTRVVRAEDGKFNRPGNILIADQFNNRVIEVDPETHRIVWHFGDGSSKVGPHSIVGTNDAERVGSLTLISGTGIPATTPPTPPLPGCPNASTGCPDNRVILVDDDGRIIWQYGPNELNTPVCATFLPNFDVLITDQGNARVIEVNLFKQVVWTTEHDIVLNNPNSAELLENGNILIADENNNQVIEVNRKHQIVHTFTAHKSVSGAAFASRLENGDTLITDSNHNRIVEVDRHDNTVWEYHTDTELGSNSAPLPTRAVRLHNGNTLISDQFNNRVIEVTPAGNIVFTQGQLNVPGNDFDKLNGPYDAKVVGDFTGLTEPPFGRSEEH